MVAATGASRGILTPGCTIMCLSCPKPFWVVPAQGTVCLCVCGLGNLGVDDNTGAGYYEGLLLLALRLQLSKPGTASLISQRLCHPTMGQCCTAGNGSKPRATVHSKGKLA